MRGILGKNRRARPIPQNSGGIYWPDRAIRKETSMRGKTLLSYIFLRRKGKTEEKSDREELSQKAEEPPLLEAEMRIVEHSINRYQERFGDLEKDKLLHFDIDLQITIEIHPRRRICL